MTETELNEQIEDETSLDNFFAKKDKSKKPKKKKKTKSDEALQGTNSEKQTKAQGDDWKDFEEEKEKDYSNLKIQTLQVIDDNSREDNYEEEGDGEGEDEDGVKRKGVDSTKWNLPATASVEPTQEAAPELPGTHNVVGGKYVPPSVKRSNMMSMGGPKLSSRKPLAAPDIQSKATFPTLSAANQDLSVQNKSTDFEAVRRGVRSTEARVDDNNSPRLALGNRYDSLR